MKLVQAKEWADMSTVCEEFVQINRERVSDEP